MNSKKKLVIIGNGISGITTAIEVRKKSDMEILVISEETEFFYSRTALMYVFMGQMKFEHTQPYENNFWETNKISLKKTKILEISTEERTLQTADNQLIKYDYLVLATGSKSNFFDWPGQNLQGVSGLYSKQDLEYISIKTKPIKKAVIVGGGLIGIELAEMLISRKIHVTFLVRESAFWNMVFSDQESKIIENHMLAHGIDLRLNTELKAINGETQASSINTNLNEEILCEYVGLTVGVSPNISFLKGSEIKTNKGILVNQYLQTNITNVYAIGDCAEQTQPQTGRRPIEAVWYTGKVMGETLAKTLTGNLTAYQPGHWFNSAKFFDIEYQTYGYVPVNLSVNERELFWQKGEKSIRIIYEKTSGKFLGINTLGIRLRQIFFNSVLDQEKDIKYVLNHFEEANFDPEFYKNYDKEIVSKFLNDIK